MDSFDTSWFSGTDFAIDDIGLDDSNYSDLDGMDFTDGGGSWWDSIIGGGDAGGGSGGWMNLLASGASSYLGNRREDKNSGRNQQYTLEQIREQGAQAAALAKLKQELEEQTYQKRQQELKDAYGQYAGMPSNQTNPFNLLSGRSPQGSGYQMQQGAQYRGS